MKGSVAGTRGEEGHMGETGTARERDTREDSATDSAGTRNGVCALANQIGGTIAGDVSAWIHPEGGGAGLPAPF